MVGSIRLIAAKSSASRMSSSMDKMAALILGGDNFIRDSMIPTLLDLAESRQYRIRHT